MTSKNFLLLCPMVPAQFSLTTPEELSEALEEFGCELIESSTVDGSAVYFAKGSMEALSMVSNNQDLPGLLVEVSNWYDNVKETTIVEISK